MNITAATNQTQTNAFAVSPENDPEKVRFKSGFLRVEALVRAVRKDDLEQLNLDVPSTVATTIGAYDKIVQCRPLVMAELPLFDVKNVDNLRTHSPWGTLMSRTAPR